MTESPSASSGNSLPSFTPGGPSGVLYIERMFLLRLCINQPTYNLHLLSIHIFQQVMSPD